MCKINRTSQMLFIISVLSTSGLASAINIHVFSESAEIPKECRKVSTVTHRLIVEGDSQLQNEPMGSLWDRVMQNLKSKVAAAKGNSLLVTRRENQHWSGGKFVLLLEGIAYDCT